MVRTGLTMLFVSAVLIGYYRMVARQELLFVAEAVLLVLGYLSTLIGLILRKTRTTMRELVGKNRASDRSDEPFPPPWVTS